MSNKLFEHTLAVYDALAERALDRDGKLTFEGSKVEAYRSVNLSQSYYTSIFDALTEMGCIEQVQRGFARTPSVIVLHKRPVLSEFEGMYRGVLTKPTKLDTLRQQIENLERRLPSIDLDGYILSFDQRLSEIEARLSRIERYQGRK
jgi:hypothetical protein